jgi:hypothetical protein
MNRLIEHYKWGNKFEPIDSQYGTIHYLPWLEKEKARIEQTSGRVAEVRQVGTRAALFVNDVRDSRYRIEKGEGNASRRRSR